MSIPDQHYAGDSLEFGVNVPDYPPADGWTLVYRFVLRTPLVAGQLQDPVELTATPDGTVDGESFDYVITASPTATASWKPGTYNWWRWVAKSGARQTLRDDASFGQMTLLQDPATAVQGADNRSRAAQALADAETALQNLLSAGASATNGNIIELTIGERRTRWASPEEARGFLVQQINFWKSRIENEDAAARIARGLGAGRGIQVRF